MVIAVECGLDDISRELRSKGYIIVSYPEYSGVVDAFIYKEGEINDVSSYENSQANTSLESNTASRSHGILIINATNKNINQIEQILQTRIYSPLF